MGIKKINSIKKIVGGDTGDDVLIVYNLFCYLTLYISYILFGIATIIFFNACFNLNKVSTGSTGREGTLMDKPIFEYLKEDDILYIDEYLLNIKSPIFITLISIFCISISAIFCIRDGWWNYYKKGVPFPYEIDNKTFAIATMSYLFTFIIIITYNEFRHIYIYKTFVGCDKEYKKDINDDILGKDPSYLKELKKIIIYMLENDEKFTNDEDIKSKLEKNIDGDVASIAKNLKLDIRDNQISILKLIIDIYVKDYQGKEKIKYIKYINDYFDLLINNKRGNYTKYYILGLAKNIPDKIDNVCNLFKNSLDDIKNKIYAYFIVIIVFFCLCFIIIPLIIFRFYEKINFDKFIIDTSYNILSITILFSLSFAFIIYFALFYTKGIR